MNPLAAFDECATISPEAHQHLAEMAKDPDVQAHAGKDLPSISEEEVIKKSTAKVEVVPVRLEKHPAADRLSIVKIYGYQVCTATETWMNLPATFEDPERPGESHWLGAYIPPDNCVPIDRPEFAFLKDQSRDGKTARIKARKLRGVVSFGLLVPAPPGAKLGDDVAPLLGVRHFEPELAGEAGVPKEKFFTGGEIATPPAVHSVKYDVDAFRRYHHLFVPGEPCLITEKVDGASAKYVFFDGRMHCGSRENWKKEFPTYDHLTVEGLVARGCPEGRARERLEYLHSKPKKKNLWWEVLERTPSLEKFCRDNPGTVVYGEVFGNVNCIKYGFPDGNRFAAFDVMKGGRWLDAEEGRRLLQSAGVPAVPVLGGQSPLEVWPPNIVGIPYDFDRVCELAEGPSLVPDAKPGTIREGCVLKPLRERFDPHVGRVNLKVVSALFLERHR